MEKNINRIKIIFSNMALFYSRKETQDEITIVLNQAVFYFVLAGFLVVQLITGFTGDMLVVGLFAVFCVIWVVGRWAANKEIKRAMRDGKTVNVLGSKFSFKNPLKFKIKK